MRPLNTQIMSALQISNDQTSDIIHSAFLFRTSVQAAVTGTPDGDLQLQGSNDPATNHNPNSFTPTNWSNIGSSVPVNAAGVFLITQQELCYEYIRLAWVSTATGVQTIAVRADVAGNLNNKYFLINSGDNAVAYYVWFNINSAGVDPMVAGKTGVEVAAATGANATTVGTALQVALDALTASFNTSGTTTVTVTNVDAGPFTPAVDSVAAPTGFTFAITTGGGSISAQMKSLGA